MPFQFHILQKCKTCRFHKDTPLSEKWQNIQGNVNHKACLRSSVENNK